MRSKLLTLTPSKISAGQKERATVALCKFVSNYELLGANIFDLMEAFASALVIADNLPADVELSPEELRDWQFDEEQGACLVCRHEPYADPFDDDDEESEPHEC